ncbi:UDP-glucosyltransferase 2-like isoform X1 [Onthophagus taurus]|uniref:UDP-glucosyltransferase 2-like isoform X1 n=1 Tax=Onthophagus taurus TaxID=166361 RepID=UPI0039BE3321
MGHFQYFSLCFIAIFSQVNSARILGVIPSASLSHQIVYRPIWKELISRGHEVVVITTDPMNDKSLRNLTEIDLHFSYDLSTKKHKFSAKYNELTGNPLQMLNAIITMNADICNEQLKHSDVKKLIDDENEHFDVVIMEVLQPCMWGFARRFNAPFIGVVSMDAQTAAYDSIGNPTHPVLNPDFMLPFAGELNFFERLTSFIVSNIIRIYGYLYIIPLNDKIIRENFGENYPSSLEFILNMDLLFINVHPLLNGIRPNVPAIVNIGAGLHIQPLKPLPEDLKSFLDNAPSDVIYFSLGSNVKSKDIIPSTRQIITETFAELPYTILWKFEADSLPNQPKNVKIMKWLPQQDVLRHPKIKLFITQAGHQSIEEAIFSHVPMVVMPFFADQEGNAKRIVLKDIAVKVDHKELTKESFKSSILEVMENKKYRENVKKLAELLQDEPMTGLEKAVWWTEHVIRHKGAKHYRSAAIEMPFYEYFLLDVIGFLLLVLFIVIYVSVKMSKLVFKVIFKLCGGEKPKFKRH